MVMTKGELKQYIELKFSERKVELKEELTVMIDEKINPLLDACYRESDKVELLSLNLVKAYEGLLTLYGLETDWRKTEPIRILNNVVHNFGEQARFYLKDRIRNAITRPEQITLDFLDYHDDLLLKVVVELRELAKPIIKQMDDLSTLQKEVELVINAEKTALKGYKMLIALGIDMSDFEEKNVKINLPAIQKFSVNTCVLNGGCE